LLAEPQLVVEEIDRTMPPDQFPKAETTCPQDAANQPPSGQSGYGFAVATLMAFLVFVMIQRLLELRLAKRNEAWARSRGAIEYGQGHYVLFFVLHAGWLMCIVLETVLRGGTLSAWWPVWLGVYALAQMGRYWVISSLGPYWNTRILIVPGGQRVIRGPYRFLRHPNYLVVALEMLSGPLMFGAWVTALVFSLLNAALLLGIRIPAEERALAAYRSSSD
jgi:methyltransferase